MDAKKKGELQLDRSFWRQKSLKSIAVGSLCNIEDVAEEEKEKQ